MSFDGITFITRSGKSAHLGISEINPYVLTSGSPGRVRKVAEFLEEAEIIESGRGLVTVNGVYRGLEVSAASTGMGPASTMITLPEIIECALGDFMTILRLGTAGSLQPHVKAGHLHIPTSAIRDEGATQAIVGPEYPAAPDPELIPILLMAAEGNGYRLGENLWLGPVHTKDNLYFKESPGFSPRRAKLVVRLSSYREMGAVSSEMEFSVYCVLRDYYERKFGRRILVGGVMAVISDFKEEGRIDVGGVDMRRMEEDLIRIGLEALVILDRLRRGERVGLEEAVARILNR